MNNFQLISKVGEGAFATVYKVKRKEDGLIYALKKISISNESSKSISNTLNQVRILASIKNPYIIGYKESFFDEKSGCIFLVTEFSEGGDLTNFITSHKKKKEMVPERQIWRMAIQMLHGLRVLHKMSIFHRDIKSANLLLSKDQKAIKLCDMNVSKISKSGLASTQAGTPYYASPEVWSDMPYNAKCDIWSLGVVLYEMTSFRPPFMANDIQNLKKKIKIGIYDRIPACYSEELQNLIRLCLITNPKERPSADSLLRNSLIRKKLYQYPNQKFNDNDFENSMNKENKLLETIKIPNRFNFGNDLKNRLPKSNYKSIEPLVDTKEERNQRSVSRRGSTDKLPQINKRKSSNCNQNQKIGIPKYRAIEIR